MDQQELQNLMQILSSIEKKHTVERISGERIATDGKLIEITQSTSYDETGAIQDEIIFNIRHFDCGCASQGRQNLGGACAVCSRICCNKHTYRCIRCRKQLCVFCISTINGIVYCHHCYVITRILMLLKIK